MKIILALICSLYASNVFAGTSTIEQPDDAVTQVIITEGSYRAPIPGMTNSVGYVTIENTGNDKVVFVSARSNVANAVEFHDHVMSNGVMKMTKVSQIEIKPKQTVKLETGGLHLMFLDLKEQNREQKQVDVFFKTTQGAELKVTLPVESIHAHHHHH